MIRGIGAYHPSAIMREKRTQKESQPKVAEVKAKPSGDDSQPEADVRPEGEAGFVWDAAKYLGDAETSFVKIKQKFENLQELMKESLNPKLDDDGRKIAHQKFVSARKELSSLAETIQIQGDALFSGKFSQKGKSVKIGKSDEETTVIRIEPRTPEGLKIQDVKIDSLVNARKAVPTMERAALEIKETEKFLKSKLDSVSYKLDKLRDRNIEKEEKTTAAPMMESQAYRYRELKTRQENAARAKGREWGLLVNAYV